MAGKGPSNNLIGNNYKVHPHFEEEFDPDTVIKFDLEGGGEDTYYMHFNRAGTEVMGLFTVSAATFDIDPIISVFVTDPNGKFMYSKRGRSLDRFSFETTEMGEYKLVFSNLKHKDEKSVKLSIHNQEAKEEKYHRLNKELEIHFDVNDEANAYISEI
jgi:hypothetical protein